MTSDALKATIESAKHCLDDARSAAALLAHRLDELTTFANFKEGKTLNQWRDEVYATAKEKGWWKEERNIGELLMLVTSELSEALEEYRMGTKLGTVYEIDRGQKKMWDHDAEKTNAKPEGFSVELVDAIIRILDLCGHLNIDVEEVMRIKTEYNKTRPYRHGGKVA